MRIETIPLSSFDTAPDTQSPLAARDLRTRLSERLESLLASDKPRHLRILLATMLLAEAAPASATIETQLAALTSNDIREALTAGGTLPGVEHRILSPWTRKVFQKHLKTTAPDSAQLLFPSRLEPDKPIRQLRRLLRKFLRPVEQHTQELNRFDASILLTVHPPSSVEDLPSTWPRQLRTYLHYYLQESIAATHPKHLRRALLFLLAAESGMPQGFVEGLAHLTLSSVSWDNQGASVCYLPGASPRRASSLLAMALQKRKDTGPVAPDSPLLLRLIQGRSQIAGKLSGATLHPLTSDVVRGAGLRGMFVFADLIELWNGTGQTGIPRLKPGVAAPLAALLESYEALPVGGGRNDTRPSAPPPRNVAREAPAPAGNANLDLVYQPSALEFTSRLVTTMRVGCRRMTPVERRGALALLLLIEQQHDPSILEDELPTLRRRDVEWRNGHPHLTFRLDTGTAVSRPVSWLLELLLREECPPGARMSRKEMRACLVGTTHNPSIPVPLGEFKGLATRYIEDFATERYHPGPSTEHVMGLLRWSLKVRPGAFVSDEFTVRPVSRRDLILETAFPVGEPPVPTPAEEPPLPGEAPTADSPESSAPINFFAPASPGTADSAKNEKLPAFAGTSILPSDEGEASTHSTSRLSVRTVALRSILQPLHACQLTISSGLLVTDSPESPGCFTTFEPCIEVHPASVPFTFNAAWAIVTLPYPLYTPYLRVAARDSEQPDRMIYTSQIMHVSGDPEGWREEPQQLAIPLLPFLVEIEKGNLVFALQGLVRRHAPRPTSVPLDGDWVALAVYEVRVNSMPIRL